MSAAEWAFTVVFPAPRNPYRSLDLLTIDEVLEEVPKAKLAGAAVWHKRTGCTIGFLYRDTLPPPTLNFECARDFQWERLVRLEWWTRGDIENWVRENLK